jgi:hypothetical protein
VALSNESGWHDYRFYEMPLPMKPAVTDRELRVWSKLNILVRIRSKASPVTVRGGP